MDFTEKHDYFLRNIDWISVVNDGFSYEEMCNFLSINSVSFDERYFMNRKYLVIHKDCYKVFFDCYVNCRRMRISRIDFKIDYGENFIGFVSDKISSWEPHSCVSKKGKLETIYFNSRQSDIFCRLYDKQSESRLAFPLTRLEYEIKGPIAFEFSKRLAFVGVQDAIDFLFNKINEFNVRQNLSSIFYISTEDVLPVDIIEDYSIKNKFRRFVKHNRNSYSYYMHYFNLSPIELDNLMTGVTDLESFLEVN